jgi:voltage-gated potassium channel
MGPNVRPRQVARLLFAVSVTLVVGTIAFRETLHEPWFQSFYRSIVTVTRTGLDSIPTNDARIVSLALVVAGVMLIAYAGDVIFESIAGGVLTGALAERRRERAIEHLHDHFIICGYGRVGQRVAEEFRASNVPFVVLDFHEDAVAAAQEDRALIGVGSPDEIRRPEDLFGPRETVAR